MKAILHADKKWGIGKANGLMFSIPADMKFFKDTTTGNVVIMGSNTLKSFPGGRPPNRRLPASWRKRTACRPGRSRPSRPAAQRRPPAIP